MTNAALKPPRGLLKIFFKIPVFVARIGFAGWEHLFGLEWMLLITTGRKSGKKRYSMVDVLLYDRESDTYYIEVGFGKESDWYQNIRVNPLFEAQVRRRRFSAMAEELSSDKAGDMIVKFVQRRPLYAKSVMKMVGIIFTTEEELRRMVPHMILLAVHPKKRFAKNNHKSVMIIKRPTPAPPTEPGPPLTFHGATRRSGSGPQKS